MKPYYLIPLLLLTACSTTPKLALRPQQPSSTSADGIRYPEVLHAYHVGRYADPNDDLIMHEQHIVYRVEENTRWDLHPGTIGVNATSPIPRDVAFSPTPVNDAVLAEVNAQRLATAQIMVEAQTLSAALAQFQSALQQAKTNLQETAGFRLELNDMQKRLDALTAAQAQPLAPAISTTNEPPDSLSP